MSLVEQRRAEFEEAYHEQFGRLPQNWNDALGKYFDAHAQGAWWAWQASRDAVVIELPEKCEFADPEGPYHKGYRQGIRSMVDSIEAAGLKVAP